MAGVVKGFQRLKEHQESKIKDCLERITEIEKMKDDCKAVKSRLETISDRLTYNVMVPMTNVAFMPGHLTHTNEILVMLGGNWFVERTAKQAVGIAERKIQRCQKMLDDLQKEKHHFSDWMAKTSEVEGNEDIVEIIEEYDAEKEKSWRDQHKENVKKHRQQMAAMKQMSVQNETEKWNRLESQEIRWGGEIESSNEAISNDFRSRQVKWQDELEKQHMKINVTHTSTATFTEKSEEEERLENDAVIQSPADIYKQFAPEAINSEPKSILKNKCSVSESDKTQGTEQNDHHAEPILKRDTIKAFTGEVIERDISENISVPEFSTRPASRFKAGRKKT